MIVKSSKANWVLNGQNGIDSLVFEHGCVLQELGEKEVLVELHAASLNYRDLAIAKGAHRLRIREHVVPGSDGAGVVTAVGSSVQMFKVGQRVVTHLAPGLAEWEWPVHSNIAVGLGQVADGTLRAVGVFHESALIPMPRNLTFEQAATLTCSALTAWNAIFGLKGKAVKESDWILVQGTGGVSIAALQFARAAGATVVATTSNEQKAARLRELGAESVINYKDDRTWGESARKLTPDGRGFDHVVDVGGNSSLAQSIKAVRTDGVVAATGLLGSSDGRDVLLIEALWNVCTVRGVLLGTREQFHDMVRFIEDHDVQLAVDNVTFSLGEVKEAYRRLEKQKHFAKIVIKIAQEP